MNRIRRWLFAEHFDVFLMVSIVVVLVVLLALVYMKMSSPDYCSETGETVRHLNAVVQECLKLDKYTRDECIRMAGGLR